MKAFLWICVFLGGSSSAQRVSRDDWRGDQLGIRPRIEHNHRASSSAKAAVCTESCREQHPLNVSTQCTIDQIFTSDLTRCVQKECETLQEVLDWQTYYASVCHLKARDTGRIQVIFSWILFGIATLSAIGRMLARSQLLKGPGFWWDDWITLFLAVISVELAACLVYTRGGWAGRDSIGIVDPGDIEELFLWMYISVPFYIIGTYGAKIVWVLLYMRMWEFNTAFRKLCWATIFVLTVCSISFTVGAIIVYWPYHYYIGDSPTVRRFHLGIDLIPVVFSVAAINIASDFFVLLLPIPKLMSLTGVSVQRKAGICAVFGLGFIVTACSIVRLRYIVPLRNTTNPTWDFGLFGTFSVVEVHLGMVSCNLPALAGLVNRMRTHRRAKRHIDQSGTSGNSSSTGSAPRKTPKLTTWVATNTSVSTAEQSDYDYEHELAAPQATEAKPSG
ncbi:hypothetical protein CB0940_00392 [Cercospora beticola]|uniref:Rhodopsin domain-containing protein n=1 Tax=Cercospora beticola TaxID=122368 RepID=A0A2G5IBT0_CERBT|nr:hypothetical protein CB0940_00392 [Cercospora beticola]PIB02235.1 hypothetical protein CB0940_00392 [Cercospora beticola]WPA95808.1 hypothetical protein RHO25_000411 [Cercospora beticola]